MKLNPAQLDRARGVLVGVACGDALGVPYEFQPKVPLEPRMIGGGLGPYAPGEWSDDTQMTVALGLALPAAGIDAIAAAFVQWAEFDATDIGGQTSSVLRDEQARTRPTAETLWELADTGDATNVGNGALMRTAPVALAYLDDDTRREATAHAVASLTHGHAYAQEACILWTDAIAHAVITGHARLDVSCLPLRAQADWKSWIVEAEMSMPEAIEESNANTVGALQAAWSAIVHTSTARQAIIAGVRAGHDTDTVGSITGALAGATYGLQSLPPRWLRDVHGLRGLRAQDLANLGQELVEGV